MQNVKNLKIRFNKIVEDFKLNVFFFKNWMKYEKMPPLKVYILKFCTIFKIASFWRFGDQVVFQL